MKRSLVIILLLLLLLPLVSCCAPPADPNGSDNGLDINEEWWLKVQTYSYLTDVEQMAGDGVSVVWWGNGLTSPQKIRTRIKDEIDDCHEHGIRYVVPISLFDIEDQVDLSVIKAVSATMMQAAVLKVDGAPHVIMENFGGDQDATQYAYDINHPDWRNYVLEQARAAVDAGADGISIDDINGNRWWVENGWGSFNPASEAGFKDYLDDKYSAAELAGMGISDISGFDYSDFLIDEGWTAGTIRIDEYPYHADYPLYGDFYDFQAKATAEFAALIMQTAKDYARQQYVRELMVTECCEYRDCTAKYVDPYFDALSAGAMYGKERTPQHIAAYKLGVAVNGRPMVAWLGDTEALMSHYDIADLYSMYMAEGYASMASLVAFPGRGSPAQYNDFVLSNKDVLDYESWQSAARIGLLYPLTTMANEQFYSQTHSLFFNMAQMLVDCQYQHDVVFSHGDDLMAQGLSQYDVMLLPNTYNLTAAEKETMLEYAEGGGQIIYIGETGATPSPFSAEQDAQAGIIYDSDWVSRMDLYCQHVQYGAMESLSAALPQYYQPLAEQPLAMDLAQAVADFSALIDGALSKRVVLPLSDARVVPLLWESEGNLVLHLINYDLDYTAKQINEKSDLTVKVDSALLPEVTSVTLVSPDSGKSSTLLFSVEGSYISFTVPALHVWDIVVVD